MLQNQIMVNLLKRVPKSAILFLGTYSPNLTICRVMLSKLPSSHRATAEQPLSSRRAAAARLVLYNYKNKAFVVPSSLTKVQSFPLISGSLMT